MNGNELKKWLGNDSSGDPTTRIVRLLSRAGSLSSAEIARELALAKSTVSTALIELRKSGMVVDAQRAPHGKRAGAGRPSTALTLNPQAGVCIGVMIEPTSLRVVLADVSHAILDADGADMPVDYSPQAAVAKVSELVDVMRKRRDFRSETLLGVGIALPGSVRPDTGQVQRTIMAKSWVGANIRGYFEAAFKAPIFADNDSNCAAIAEMMWGAAAGCDDFVFFKIDAGVGGAIVVNRKVLLGKAGGAGEFGHMPMDPEGDLCACGNRGCLELTASMSSVKRGAQRLFGPEVTIERIIQLAVEGDTGCRRLIADAGEAAGRGLALIGTALNPALIVIGGRGASAGPLLLTPLRAAYDRFALSEQWPEEIRTPIIPGTFLSDDSVLGAVGLVLRHHGRLGNGSN